MRKPTPRDRLRAYTRHCLKEEGNGAPVMHLTLPFASFRKHDPIMKYVKYLEDIIAAAADTHEKEKMG